MAREKQVNVAEASPVGAWVDTDDLPMKGDNLHYGTEGFNRLGQRFAETVDQIDQEVIFTPNK